MTDTQPATLPTPWARLRAHWAAPTWLRTAHVGTGVPIALLAGAVLIGLTALSVVFVWTVVVPLVALILLFWTLPLFSRWQRARFAAFLGVEIPPVPSRPLRLNLLKWLLTEVRTRSTWRQIGYHLLALLITTVGFFTVVMAWSGFLVAAVFAVQIGVAGGTWQSVLCAAGAVTLAVVVPWVARGITGLDTIAAEALLGPSLSDQLASRVETLRESRAEVVEAADAERRRIERDLHDGTQQRLVWLAMNLGMARATLTDIPESAREVIAQAHEESKLALRELRSLVRGLHPAVLSDEGLDAALSGLAVRAPLPVRLSVDVPERTSPTIEAVAFFVVSEALTNIAKHAGARSAEVTVGRAGDRLCLVVRDDGRGGAGLGVGGGTGLRGLAQRVGSVDGTLKIDSPPGGPTTIEVSLPCE